MEATSRVAGGWDHLGGIRGCDPVPDRLGAGWGRLLHGSRAFEHRCPNPVHAAAVHVRVPAHRWLEIHARLPVPPSAGSHRRGLTRPGWRNWLLDRRLARAPPADIVAGAVVPVSFQ